MKGERFFIYGCGKVGKVLGKVLKEHGFIITGCFNRREADAKSSSEFLGGVTPYWEGLSLKEVITESDVIVLSVRDDVIGEVSKRLALDYRELLKDKYIFHLSGALSSELLAPFKKYGAIVGVIHPLYPFFDIKRSVKEIKKIYFGISGDKRFFEFAKRMINRIGGGWFILDEEKKSLYHISAIISSNFLPLLYHLSLSLLKDRCGIEEERAKKAIEVLMRASLENIFQAKGRLGLTGPIVRKDKATLLSHLRKLALEESSFYPFFKEATLLLAEIAYSYRIIDSGFKEVLKKEITELESEIRKGG